MITLEGHLKKICDNTDNELYNNWIVIKRELTNKLNTVTSYFQHFSMHDASHCEQICSNIERFLGVERIEKLSVTDTWMLLMAFYSHDLGMALKYEDIELTFQDEKFKDELKKLKNGDNIELSGIANKILNMQEKKDYEVNEELNILDMYRNVQIIIEEHYRKGHALRSGDYIEKFLKEKFSDINLRMIDLLKKVCISHQEDIRNIDMLYYEENGLFHQDYVHPRFIAGMLCLGDLLDMDTNRFNKYLLESASTLSEQSKLHLEKHRALKHFLITPRGIEIEIDSPSMKVHRVVSEWIQWLEETINYLALRWSSVAPINFGAPPQITNKKLLIKGNDLFNKYADLKFVINQSTAMELFHGANIYNEKFVCIREIVQNAIDSSLIQLWLDLNRKEELEDDSHYKNILDCWRKFGTGEIDYSIFVKSLYIFRNYPITIKIYIGDKEEVCIEVIDNGTGISNKELNKLVNIGTKKDERTYSDIIESMPSWLKPSGQFGIGLQSVFLVTNKFEMITKFNDEPSKKIIIENGKNNKGYITVEAFDKYERGTKIKFSIDSEKISDYDLEKNELDFRRERRVQLIFKKIENWIDTNIYINNYFDINIIIYNKYNDEEKRLTKSHSLFLEDNFIELISEGKIIDSNYNNDVQGMIFRYYDTKYNSLCEIEFPYIFLGSYKYTQYVYRMKFRDKCNNRIYFKNEFVCILDNMDFYDLLGNTNLFKYFKFTLNIFSGKASKVLNIGRDGIKSEYKQELYIQVIEIIRDTFKALWNKIIGKKITGEYHYLEYFYQIFKYFKIADLTLQDYKKLYYDELYQNIGMDHFVNKFTYDYVKDKLFIPVQRNNTDIRIGGLWCVDKDLIRASDLDKINSSCCNALWENVPLISYQPKSITITRINDKSDYYIEMNMEKNVIDSEQILVEYDNLFLIGIFIEATIKQRSIILGIKNFKYLVIKRYYRPIIILPFESKHYNRIVEVIENKTINEFNREEFIKEVISTQYYSDIVEYIINKTKKERELINDEYLKLIECYLNLLIKFESNQKGYQEYVKNLLYSYKNPSIN